MFSLILSIISSTSIFIVFKLLGKYSINIFNVIVINYITAASLGFLINDSGIDLYEILNSGWLIPALIIGTVFILTFYIIGISTQKAGIAVTTIAAKMSVIFPILFSIIYYSEHLNLIKVAGIISALIAVILSITKKDSSPAYKKYLYLPLILFILLGIVDSILKYSQEKYITNDLSSLFSAILFTIAGITGILISVTNRTIIRRFSDIKIYYWGIILGILNFGSVFFLINALNENIFESSILFGINNIGIVALSVLSGLLLFREKLSLINLSGIFLAFVAIYLLMIS